MSNTAQKLSSLAEMAEKFNEANKKEAEAPIRGGLKLPVQHGSSGYSMKAIAESLAIVLLQQQEILNILQAMVPDKR